jgi:cytidine deaminase
MEKGRGIPENALAGVDVDALVEASRRVRKNAHAPYSRYSVGAALLADDGRVFLGVNVENSAYPASLCAEHAAIGSAVAAGATKFRAIAVCTDPKAGAPPGSPCGKCRQALSEFGLDLLVILTGPNTAPELVMLVDLLPRAFSSADL